MIGKRKKADAAFDRKLRRHGLLMEVPHPSSPKVSPSSPKAPPSELPESSANKGVKEFAVPPEQLASLLISILFFPKLIHDNSPHGANLV